MAAAVLICLTVCAAPWAFGAVEPAWWSLAALLCLVAGAGTLAARAARGRAFQELPRGAEWLLLGVVALPLAMLVPLPAGVFTVLSPRGAELLASVAPPDVPAWLPLSLAPRATLHAAVLAGGYAATFWVLARTALRPERATTLTGILVAGGAALAAFGLAQRLIAYDPQAIYWSVPLSEHGTPFGPYVNRNHFGGAMCLVAGLAAGFAGDALAQARRPRAALGACVLLLAVVALLATASRGALLGLGCGTLLTLIGVGRSGRRRTLIAIAVVGLLAVAVLAVTGRLDELSGRLFTLYGRWRNRFGVQYDAWTVFLQFPLAGTGLGSFEHVYPPFQTVRDMRHFSDAHSDWAQLLMDAGLAGAALTLLAFRHVGRRIAGALRGAGGTAGRTDWAVLGPAAGALGVCAHGFFEVNLHIPSNALLFTATLSLAYAAAVRGRAPEAERPIRSGDAPVPHP